MQNLTRTFRTASLGLILNSCSGENEKTNIPVEPRRDHFILQGTVIDELYTPPWGDSKDSEYTFSIDTQFGKKAIYVDSYGGIPIEPIALLIEKDTKVEIDIKNTTENQQVFYVSPVFIKIF